MYLCYLVCFKMRFDSELLVLIVLCSFAIVGTNAEIKLNGQKPDVTISNGKLGGKIEKSRDGRPFYSFYDIPYAKFTKRFAPADPPEDWNGMRNAAKARSICPQAYPGFQPDQVFGFEGDEDCLHLNVFVPKIESTQPLPVMVVIHPGFFLFGQGAMLQPTFLMDEDIIVITFNYRLGALGFLTTEDSAAPANIGLRDQILALKWVQKNIAQFGGDPAKVTIFGGSAGGCSVHLLMMSPQAKGLFTAAVAQSGTALSPWAFQNHPTNVTMKFAEAVGCLYSTNAEIIECLRELPAEELVMEQLKRGSMIRFEYRFLPSPELLVKDGAVIPDWPEKMLQEGKIEKVPFILGGVERDGLVASAMILDDEYILEQFNTNWTGIAPRAFLYDEEANENITPVQREKITSKIKAFYFGGQPINSQTLDNLTHLYTDSWFLRGIEKTAKLHARHGATVFPYMFTFSGSFSFLHLAGIMEHDEPAHGDDLLYLFGTSIAPPPKKGSREDTFSRKYVKLLASFVKHGNPASTWGNEWHALSPNESPIKWYSIDENTKYEEYPFEDRLDFWDHLSLVQ